MNARSITLRSSAVALALACAVLSARAADAPAAPASAPASAAHPATVVQPRAFGHVLGDMLTQRVLLAHAGRAVEPAALPAADRVGLFLERRTPRIESDTQGQRWLVIDYQVINAPRALTAAALPALALATTAGTTLAVAAWPISLGPLTPAAAFDQGDLRALRPDHAVEPRPTADIERQLRASAIALAALLLAWGGWWLGRNRREAQRLPFARAWQQLRRLDEASPEAWLALHHALNATAGRAVHGATLARLLAEAPHLQPLQARLADFFRQSGARFFAVDASASAPASFPLRELGRALREAERRHHG